MEPLGAIKTAGGSADIAYEDWVRLVETHPNLSRVPPREGINPFTRQPMTFNGHPGDAHVVVAGQVVGGMFWTEVYALISVEGDAARVEPIAIEIAARLAAQYQPEEK
jgi:hypothetical protein